MSGVKHHPVLFEEKSSSHAYDGCFCLVSDGATCGMMESAGDKILGDSSNGSFLGSYTTALNSEL